MSERAQILVEHLKAGGFVSDKPHSRALTVTQVHVKPRAGCLKIACGKILSATPKAA